MATITTRAGKGSALTFTEMDDNFTNLNTDKLETAGGTLTGNLTMASGKTVTIANTYTFPTTDGSPNQFLKTDGAGNLSFATVTEEDLSDNSITDLQDVTITSPVADQVLKYNGTLWVNSTTPGLLNVVEDTTPQLGGDLDILNHAITSSNANVTITPSTSSNVHIDLATNGAAWKSYPMTTAMDVDSLWMNGITLWNRDWGDGRTAGATIDGCRQNGLRFEGSTTPSGSSTLGERYGFGTQFTIALHNEPQPLENYQWTDQTNETNPGEQDRVNSGVHYKLELANSSEYDEYDGTLSITASGTTLTSSASEFDSGDVGKTIMIKGAGQSGNDHYSTVASYTSATEIELDDAAGTTVSNAKGFMTDVSQCRFQMVAGPEDGEHRFMHFAGEVYKNNFPFVNVRHFAKDFKATASSAGSTGSGSGSITLEARDATTISANQSDVTLTATNGDVVIQAPSGQITFETLAVLKDYASTALPTGVNGAIISINDNNYKPAYYNGSTWKYIADDTDV